MAKTHQDTVNTDQARESIQPVVQPSVDVEFVGIFTEDARQPVITGDVVPDVLTF